MKQTRRNFRWLFWIFALLMLAVPAASHAWATPPFVGVGQNFEGLPDTYNGEPEEGWLGNHYDAAYYHFATTGIILSTREIRYIGGSKYICTGWKNGTGNINPPQGDGNQIIIPTLVTESSLTWVYKKLCTFTVEVTPFEQTIWSWGWNRFGQVGNGQGNNNVLSPVRVYHTDTDTDWISIAPGSLNSYAVKKDGTLWKWGLYAEGQVCGPSPCSFSPTQLGTETDWLFVTASENFAVALKKDGTLWHGGVTRESTRFLFRPTSQRTPQCVSTPMTTGSR